MSIIYEFPLSISRALRLIGLIAAIGFPALAVGAWAGWQFRRTREPGEVREARGIKISSRSEMHAASSRQIRAIRLLEAARAMDDRAEDLHRDARESRRLGVEIIRGNLGAPKNPEISLVGDE